MKLKIVAYVGILIALIFHNGQTLAQGVSIPEDTLLRGSYPIFITQDDTTLVILPIGAYNELKFGTALFSSCAEQNDLLQRSVIVTEAWKDDYKVLYRNSQEALRISNERSGLYQKGRDECRVQYSTLYVYTEEVESSLKTSKRENWIWRGAALLGIIIVIAK